MFLPFTVKGVSADAKSARCRRDVPPAFFNRLADCQHFQMIEAGQLIHPGNADVIFVHITQLALHLLALLKEILGKVFDFNFVIGS